MGQNWMPEAKNTHHYNAPTSLPVYQQQQYTRAGNGAGLRSNRWTHTAQLNTTFSHNFQKAQEFLCLGGVNGSARKNSKERVQTALNQLNDRNNIKGILEDMGHHPLSTKNLNEYENYNPLATHQRPLDHNAKHAPNSGPRSNSGNNRQQNSLRIRATSASYRNQPASRANGAPITNENSGVNGLPPRSATGYEGQNTNVLREVNHVLN